MLIKTEYVTYPYGDSALLHPTELTRFEGITYRDSLLYLNKSLYALDRCNEDKKAMKQILVNHNRKIKNEND